MMLKLVKSNLDQAAAQRSVRLEVLRDLFSVFSDLCRDGEPECSLGLFLSDVAQDGLGQLQVTLLFLVFVFEFNSGCFILGHCCICLGDRLLGKEVVTGDGGIHFPHAVLAHRDILECLGVGLSAVRGRETIIEDREDHFRIAEGSVRIQPLRDVLTVLLNSGRNGECQGAFGLFLRHVAADALRDREVAGLLDEIVLKGNGRGLLVLDLCLRLIAVHGIRAVHGVFDGVVFAFHILGGLSHGVVSKIHIFNDQGVGVSCFIIIEIREGQSGVFLIFNKIAILVEILAVFSLDNEGQSAVTFVLRDLAFDGLGQFKDTGLFLVFILDLNSFFDSLGDRRVRSCYGLFRNKVVTRDGCVGFSNLIVTDNCFRKSLGIGFSAVVGHEAVFDGEFDSFIMEFAVLVKPLRNVFAVFCESNLDFEFQGAFGFFFGDITADRLLNGKTACLVVVIIFEFDPGGLSVGHFC